MTSFLIWIVVCLAVNSIVSILVTFLGGNSYLASMLTSLILAFLLALMNTRFDRKHFYKYRFFWVSFMGTALLFLIVDLILFLL